MARVSHYSVHSPSRKRLRVLGTSLLALVIVLFVVTVYIRHIYLENIKPVSGSQQNHLVTIARGDSLVKIASTLHSAGVIRSTWAFEWYVKNDSFARNELQAGTYNFRANQSVVDIVNQLTDGQIATNLVTILPGQRLDQVEQALMHNGYTKTDVTNAISPTQYLKKYSMFSSAPSSANLEGFLYPDSFQKSSDTTAATIVDESLAEMQKKLTPDIVSGMAQQGLTIYQGVTIASIIEQEVGNPADKPVVAQVFLTRLHSGMDLGSDVTAYYGAIIAGQPPSVNYDSPYNTLLHTGLPPGPISNVDQTYLQAVAHPANTDYLYFVTGDNGVTYYSQTLQEHQQQVQLYCQTLCPNS